jgi:hypothetical protein
MKPRIVSIFDGKCAGRSWVVGWHRGQRHRRVEVRVWRMPAAEIAAHSPKADSFGYSRRYASAVGIDAGRLAGNSAMTRARVC